MTIGEGNQLAIVCQQSTVLADTLYCGDVLTTATDDVSSLFLCGISWNDDGLAVIVYQRWPLRWIHPPRCTLIDLKSSDIDHQLSLS